NSRSSSAARRLSRRRRHGKERVAASVSAMRPRSSDLLIADRGYDDGKDRRLLWARQIKPMIARRGAEHGSRVGRQRWGVERGFAHLHNFRRLRIGYKRHPKIHTALLILACSILCWRRLQSL